MFYFRVAFFSIMLSLFSPSLISAQNVGGLTAEEFAMLENSDGYKLLGKNNTLAANGANLKKWANKAKQAKLNLKPQKVDRNKHYQVVLQVGHFPRKKGATGSQGKLINEQEGASLIAELLAAQLTELGIDFVLIGADDWEYENGVKQKGTLVKTDIFLSLHLDGSKKPCASSASLGYNPKFGKASMQLFGAGLAIALDYNAADFMRDNFTKNLSHYGDYGKSNSQIAEGIVELSELSCSTQEKDFLLSAQDIANNLAVAFTFALKK